MDRPPHRPTRADRARARLVRALAADGLLTDPAWRAAFAEVPRHAFLENFFRPGRNGQWVAVAAGDRGWLDLVYRDRVLVTQLDDDPGVWATARREGPVTGMPTSSSSQPAIMAIMLAALRVADGHRVLEIGTGTGYNAALLTHRLGAEPVTTVDIDAGLATSAARRLAALGPAPTCAVADGVDGYPDRAPYDRVLATCAVAEIPPAWLTQTVPGGEILTTLHRPIGAGLVRITVGTGGRGEGRVLAEDGRFMPLRAHRIPTGQPPTPDEWGADRATDLPAEAITAGRGGFEFYAGLVLPGVGISRERPDGGGTWFTHADGSWARHTGGAGDYRVWQGGPRRLWDLAETAYADWHAHGRPDRNRFGLTVEPGRQDLWLDGPDGPHHWPLRQP